MSGLNEKDTLLSFFLQEAAVPRCMTLACREVMVRVLQQSVVGYRIRVDYKQGMQGFVLSHGEG